MGPAKLEFAVLPDLVKVSEQLHGYIKARRAQAPKEGLEKPRKMPASKKLRVREPWQ